MKLESVGILISLRPFDEKNAIAQIFSRDFGIMSGMMRGAVVARTNKPLVGQFGSVSWNARLDDALGVFHWDAEKNLAAPIMINSNLLPFMNSAFGLITAMLPEREPYEHLYDETIEIHQNSQRLSAVVGFVGEGAGGRQAIVPYLLDILLGGFAQC